MDLPFTHAGLHGTVRVDVAATDDPTALGAWPQAAGLPHCEAAVDFPGRGYTARLGWVQLVRSTDNHSGGTAFEMDPLEILGEVSHPFCFFGIKSTLFDAPARGTREDLDWVCHSFLCHIAVRKTREVHALTGFSWGFVVFGGSGTPTPASPLASWDEHLPLLREAYPDWSFAPGYRTT